ncbi:thioester reductase domain-containing protein [Nostoc favosum]|uniref:Thioester reductase domain-containing protein n=1 Tax=Nostoc favosum CHAB5714 TaxID=2780399 RepID=A0ABS8IFI9_9NOSO|nr:thioester reductase domain-containing protein [Nostoc favosum]MCC5602611.1 thioester reductase domain-containing protein [Nostoc favosum CHAB5714]
MNQPMYLKPNVIVEPLVNQWYAWSHLISPATAAMYIANSHLPIMQSFIAAPQVHRDALKNPAMIGSPFINYDASRVEEIRLLLEKTQKQQAQMLALAQAIPDLDKLLAENTVGASLEPLYERIPTPLRGYVELVQDGNNHPSIRFIEGLLYRSYYYNPANQSVNLYLGDGDTRGFVLSTPRLPAEDSLHLQIPFCDRRLDQLFSLRHNPLPYNEIRDILEISAQQDALFSQFFTTTPPTQEPDYDGEAVRIRYFGHACVLIETQSLSIFCDPLISYPHASGIKRYTFAELPQVIDYVLITHNHQDHVMLETLLQLRHKIKTVVVPKSNKGTLIDPSLKLMLQQIGFENVQEIDELEIINIADGYIAGLPFLGEHGDLNIGAKAAYLVNLKGRSILCAADSNNIDPQLYTHLHQIFGDIDVLFIGMECDGAAYNWAYGSLLTQKLPRKIAKTRRLDGSNAQRAIALVNQFHPQQVYVYAMGQEPWLTFITSILYTPESKPIVESNQLVAYCHSQEIVSKRLFGCEEILLTPRSTNTSILGSILSESEVPLQPVYESLISPIQEFLTQLQRLDIRIWLDNVNDTPKLRCNAPKGVLTDALKEQLQAHKAEIIEFLQNPGGKKVEVDWGREAILDSAIVPPTPLNPPDALGEIDSLALPKALGGLGRGSDTPKNHILLTGATGFVGAFLLHELLCKTPASIYCLVQAETTEAAHQRIKTALQSYKLWDASLATRIVPVVGNLAQPNLGLSPFQFQDLASQIDVIYHNGARVNHTEPYTRLKGANVLGTQEVLRLASCTKLKTVHLISTISVFAANSSNTKKLQVDEQDSLDDYLMPVGGYAQSKWVAEKLVIEASKRGIPINIYRLGAISGHSQTGVFNQNDFLYKSLLGYVQMGSMPDGTMPLEILPVDYVSRAIVELSSIPFFGQTFHLIQSQPVSSDIIFEQLQKMGYSIKKVPYEQWYNQLLEIANHSPEHILYPLVSLFPRNQTNNVDTNKVRLKFSDRNTQKALNGMISPPNIDGNLIQIYLNYLINTGWMKAPAMVEVKS